MHLAEVQVLRPQQRPHLLYLTLLHSAAVALPHRRQHRRLLAAPGPWAQPQCLRGPRAARSLPPLLAGRQRLRARLASGAGQGGLQQLGGGKHILRAGRLAALACMQSTAGTACVRAERACLPACCASAATSPAQRAASPFQYGGCELLPQGRCGRHLLPVRSAFLSWPSGTAYQHQGPHALALAGALAGALALALAVALAVALPCTAHTQQPAHLAQTPQSPLRRQWRRRPRPRRRSRRRRRCSGWPPSVPCP